MDDGPPGLRHYHAAYYGAFLRDPDGNKAACRRAEQQHKRSIARHSLRPDRANGFAKLGRNAPRDREVVLQAV